MKKPLFCLLAVAVCLTACTSASKPELDGEVFNATVENAAPAEELASFPVGSLIRCENSTRTPEAWYHFEQEPPEWSMQVIRLDYATGQSSCLHTFPQEENTPQGPLMVQSDAVQCVAGNVLYTLPLDGSAVQTQTLTDDFSPGFFDAYGAYEFWVGSMYSQSAARRLDLETGQVTELTVPPQIQEIWAVGQNRFVLRRLVTSAPLPDSHREPEQYTAALQTAINEYDWYDPATGALEKIWEEPYYGIEEADTSQKERYFLGMRGDRLYFQTTHLMDETSGVEVLDVQIESCAPDGSDWQVAASAPADAQGGTPFYEGTALRWIIDCTTGKTQIFDLADGNWYTIASLPGDAAQPEALAGDGRVLLDNGIEPDGENYRMTYAMADVADFLAGSTERTPIVDAPVEPSA